MRVLLFGGYQPLVRVLQRGLAEEGVAVDVARDVQEVHGKVATGGYDVLIHDLMPRGDAVLSRVRQWRDAGLRTPVLVLAAPPGFGDPVGGPDAEVSWLAKPFGLEELLARLRALARPTEADRFSSP